MEPTTTMLLSDERTDLVRLFAFKHLPPDLQAVSKPFCELAFDVASGPINFETNYALRQLLLAKDAAVRAYILEQ